ncbi:DUF1127 domain-containing protein [Roseibium sediminicola]|uniref:DUF1127 domain-containing protein n=1 Tax=Roseibium sediminicola TaxID=2933272 RepID=A0ABT0GW55_9HYPH|nr:DUF1127 domain-containing protein [Roseibium sp. CAU 1639]MCK7613679.1 DUF1127 domain-containing protein [Roseibium sp. CAU 1639]
MSLEIDTVFRSRANSRGLLLSVLRACVAGLRNYHQRRATDRALSCLSDEDLRDIGLMRTSDGYREMR